MTSSLFDACPRAWHTIIPALVRRAGMVFSLEYLPSIHEVLGSPPKAEENICIYIYIFEETVNIVLSDAFEICSL